MTKTTLLKLCIGDSLSVDITFFALPFFLLAAGGTVIDIGIAVSAQAIGAGISAFFLPLILSTFSITFFFRVLFAITILALTIHMILPTVEAVVWARLMLGLSAGKIVLFQTIVGRQYKGEERRKLLSSLSAIIGIAMVAGAVLSSFVLFVAPQGIEYTALYGIAVLLSISTWIGFELAFRGNVGSAISAGQPNIPPKDLSMTLKIRTHLADWSTIIILFLSAFLIAATFQNLVTTYPIVAQSKFGWDAKWFSLYIAIGACIGVAAQLLVLQKLANPDNDPYLFSGALVILGLSQWALSQTNHSIFAVVFIILFSISLSISSALVYVMAAQFAEAINAEKLIGWATASRTLGQVLGPTIGGTIFFQWSQSLPYTILFALLFAASIGSATCFPRWLADQCRVER